MSFPILYESTTTEFSNNGIGTLSDAVYCSITEERNGMFELEMQYPVTGIHFSDIALRCIVTAKPNPYDDPQPFRIYRMTRPLNGLVTIYAEHISYDLTGIVVSPFEATGIQGAFSELKSKSSTENIFTFFTDKTTPGTMKVTVPTSLRSLLGGVQGSILDVYGGGEYKFDKFNVTLHQNRGADNGVSIRYGKNLIDIQQEENCSSVYTGVYPYWKGTVTIEETVSESEDVFVELTEKIVKADGTYNFTRILPLDFSSEWQEKPSETQLRERAQRYVKSNNIGVPKVSLDVSFVQLEQTQEYKNLAIFERVSLCDTVSVIFPDMGVSAKAKIIKTVFDVLLDRYESISIGDARGTLADTILDQAQETEKKLTDTRTFLEKAIDDATQDITGNRGGYVVLHDNDGDGYPDELLVMDMPTIDSATKVWRWNKAGLGYSNTGYEGKYGTAITAKGQIVANFVNTGELNASVIKAGVIKNLDNKNETFYLDVESGELRMAASSFKIEGKTVDEIADDKAGAAQQAAQDYAGDLVDALDDSLTQEDVFNRLTRNGAAKGLYIDESGNLFINASYIKSGTISADLIKGGTLILGGKGGKNGFLKVLDENDNECVLLSYLGIGAIGGNIAGWGINDHKIFGGGSNGTGVAVMQIPAPDTTYVFGAGGTSHSNYADCLFRVNKNGNLAATNGFFNSMTIQDAGNKFLQGAGISNGTYYGGYYSGGTLGSPGGNYTGSCSGSTLDNCSLKSTALDTGAGYIRANSGRLEITASVFQCQTNAVMSDIIVAGKTHCLSDLFVTGSKNRTIKTKDFGARCLSAFETPLPMFADCGTARIADDGESYIVIDPVFAETVDSDVLPIVFLTKYGAGDIWVDSVTHGMVTVKGTPGLGFAWETRYKQANCTDARLPKMEVMATDDYVEPDYAEDANIDKDFNQKDYSALADEYLFACGRSQKDFAILDDIEFQDYELSHDYLNSGIDYFMNFERRLIEL